MFYLLTLIIPLFKVVISNLNKSFTYDFAFDGEVEQTVVYQSAVRPIVENLFKGNQDIGFDPYLGTFRREATATKTLTACAPVCHNRLHVARIDYF